MRRQGALAGLALLLATMPALGDETLFWLKRWTVTAVDGAPADRAAFTRLIGTEITLERGRLVDPLAADCLQGVNYDDIRPRPATELAGHFGNFWRWPKFPKPVVTAGWIRCDGSNVGAFAFVNAEQAYLFYEGGAVIRLE